MRRNIYDILNDENIDIRMEYSRLYSLFYSKEHCCVLDASTVEEMVEVYFREFGKNLIKRCISLEDFNKTFGFDFREQPSNFNINYLLLFYEYVFNFANVLSFLANYEDDSIELKKLCEYINECTENIGYKFIEKEGIFIIVENNPFAMSVAEIVEPKISYSVLEYNHFKLKGNVFKKKMILKQLAEDIESERKKLKSICSKLCDNLFQLLNAFIRHETNSNVYISSLNDDELEKVYDEIYEMYLLAKMQLEYHKNSKFVSEVIKNLRSK